MAYHDIQAQYGDTINIGDTLSVQDDGTRLRVESIDADSAVVVYLTIAQARELRDALTDAINELADKPATDRKPV